MNTITTVKPMSPLISILYCGGGATQPMILLERKLPEVDNGWKYSIITQNVTNSDGLYYEGVGIPPEIYIKNTMAERDQCIDRTRGDAITKLNNQNSFRFLQTRNILIVNNDKSIEQ